MPSTDCSKKHLPHQHLPTDLCVQSLVADSTILYPFPFFRLHLGTEMKFELMIGLQQLLPLPLQMIPLTAMHPLLPTQKVGEVKKV
jgi:hypothetical protein